VAAAEESTPRRDGTVGTRTYGPRTMRKSSFPAVVMLSVAVLGQGSVACFGVVAGEPGGHEAAGGPGESLDYGDAEAAHPGSRDEGNDGGTSTTVSGIAVSGSSGSSPVPSGGSAAVIIASTNVDEDGAIAADDANVYWTELGDDGVFSLMGCPVTGCMGGSPRRVWGAVNAGSVPGELLVESGLVYFQTTDGELVDCPASGCGQAPTFFASTAESDNGSASLASDGVNIYWEDSSTLYACAIGATCAAPRAVTRLASSTVVEQIVPSGSSLYWVDGSNGNLETVAIGGGSASTLCSVPGVSSGIYGQGAFTVLGAYAYVSTGVQQDETNGGIYRCPLAGGDATLYTSGASVLSIATDGASLYWLTGSTTGATQLDVCAPGPSCATPSTFLGPVTRMEGFALYGNYVYTVAPQIEQTAKSYR